MGGRGRGRGVALKASDFLISSQTSQVTRSSKSKKRLEISPTKELSEQATATKSRPSPGSMTDDEDEVDIGDQTDPRCGNEWKIQRKNGFQKDRDEKAKVKAGKLSKTAKRNSKEPLIEVEEDEDMFDFLDKMMASDTPTAPMLGTSKEPTVNPNLDSSKVMDWFKSGKPKPAPLDQHLDQFK